MKKSDCTPEQWAAHRAYQRAYSQRPEAAEKRHAKNRAAVEAGRERERYQQRKASGKIAKHERTPEQKRERRRAWDEKYNTPENRAARAERIRQREAAEPERLAARKKYLSDYARKRNTGFTAEQYAEAMERQGGGCAVCKSTMRLHADHDHDTGAPRGILCGPCNQAEGLIARTGLTVEEFARRLADYLANPTL
jgi:hypothetical protein